MRFLVCGDRNWKDRQMVKDVIERNRFDMDEIISGGAPGADTHAYFAANELGIPIRIFFADWKRYGRGAGPIRNRQMLTEGKPDRVIAFHDNIGSSKGTLNMITIAHKEKIPVGLYTHDNPTGVDPFPHDPILAKL